MTNEKSETEIDKDIHILDNKELHDELEKEGGAGMSIWLGLLVDGIPESFVIGAGFLTVLSMKLGAGIEPVFLDIIPYTLIGGLFLSNFPEAIFSIRSSDPTTSAPAFFAKSNDLYLIFSIFQCLIYFIHKYCLRRDCLPPPRYRCLSQPGLPSRSSRPQV